MNKNAGKRMRGNSPKNDSNTSQPEPLSGSKKVKNRNHSGQNSNPNHGM